MNTGELEQRMRNLLDDQEYIPEDGAWNKMQQDLNPKRSSRRLFALFPAWKAAAAIALLLIMAATGRYFILKEKQPVQQTVATKNSLAPATGTNTASTKTNTIVPIQLPAVARQGKNIPGQTLQQKAFKAPATALPVMPKQQGQPEPQIASSGNQQQPLPSATGNPTVKEHNYALDYGAGQQKSNNRFNMGIAANIGKPSLGRVQYNVGVVARQNITDRIFAEATVSLASTQVNYSESISDNNHEGFIGSSDGSLSGVKNPDVNVNYASNIIAIGVAPAIGIKATRNLSLSIGGDVYKSLNRTLSLENSRSIKEQGYTALTEGKEVTDWDAGIKGQMDYKLGRKFSVSTQYRQGLTQYILIDGKSFKNSVFNIGLKYYIGK